MSFTAFRCFVCSEETNTLNADPLITCSSDNAEYVMIQLLGVLGVLLWPVGVPCFYLFLLWKHFGPSGEKFIDNISQVVSGSALEDSKYDADMRRRGQSVDKVQQHLQTVMKEDEAEQLRLFQLESTSPSYLTFLSGEFEPQCWWCPVFEQYAKLMLTCGTIFRAEHVVEQLVMGILINIVAMLVQFFNQPRKDFNDDMFSMYCHVMIFLVLLWSLLVEFQNLNKSDSETILKLGGEVDGSMGANTFEVATLGQMLVFSCASTVMVFLVFIIFEVKSAAKVVTIRRKWDEIKHWIDDGLTEEEVLERMGGNLKGHAKDTIQRKFKEIGEQRASNMEEYDDGDAVEMMDLEDKKGGGGGGGGDGKAELLDFRVKNPMIGGRAFGGKDAAKDKYLRHQSGEDAVGLGAGNAPISKHEKYKARFAEENNEEFQKEQHANMGKKKHKIAPPTSSAEKAHIARSQGYGKETRDENSIGGRGGRGRGGGRGSGGRGGRGRGATFSYKGEEGEPGKMNPPPGKPPPANAPQFDTVLDDASGENYYVNRKSGESTWEKPDFV